MNRHDQAKCLQILYIGDENRGRLFQEAALKDCRQVTVTSLAGWERHKSVHPDLVVLDGFPDSGPANAAFYHFRQDEDVRFIALNEQPHAAHFSYVNALSFLRMIHRDASPDRLLTEMETLHPEKGCSPVEKHITPALPYRNQSAPCCC